MVTLEFTCKKCEKHYVVKGETIEEALQKAVDADLTSASPATMASNGLRYNHYMETHYTREGGAKTSKFDAEVID